MTLRLAIAILLLGFAISPAASENLALVIGIDEYQDRNNINPLSGAARDAKELARALTEVADFPAANVRVLTSDGDIKPTGANIVFELGQLAKAVKPGDTVFIAYSGHGVESEADEITYLLPYDTDARTEATLTRTGLSTVDVFKQIKKLPARAVIIALDMCRSDPRKGARDVTAVNKLGKRQADNFRNLVLETVQGSPNQPSAPSSVRLLVTLFACSPGQRSWEWSAKRRGYFSYFLEEGLRSGAADSSGVVRLPNLISYLEKAVPGAVQREEGQDQIPAKLEVGTGAQEVILAKSRPAGSGGETAVAAHVGPSPKERYDAAFQRGMELAREGRQDAAQLKFEEARDIDPKAVRPVVWLADIAFWFRKDLDESEKLYKKALELDPSSGRVVGAYANYWFARRDLSKSAELYRKALELAPDDVRLHIGYATVAQFSGNSAEAEKHFKRASEIDPKDADSVAGLGFLRTSQGKLEEAERLLKHAVDLDPKGTMARVYLAETYSSGRRYAEAIQVYEQAITLDPKNPNMRNGLGIVLLRKGDTKAAIAKIQEAIDLDPKQGLLRASLASALLKNGERNEARREAQKAIDLGYREKDPVFDALGIKP